MDIRRFAREFNSMVDLYFPNLQDPTCRFQWRRILEAQVVILENHRGSDPEKRGYVFDILRMNTNLWNFESFPEFWPVQAKLSSAISLPHNQCLIAVSPPLPPDAHVLRFMPNIPFLNIYRLICNFLVTLRPHDMRTALAQCVHSPDVLSSVTHLEHLVRFVVSPEIQSHLGPDTLFYLHHDAFLTAFLTHNATDALRAINEATSQGRLPQTHYFHLVCVPPPYLPESPSLLSRIVENGETLCKGLLEPNALLACGGTDNFLRNLRSLSSPILCGNPYFFEAVSEVAPLLTRPILLLRPSHHAPSTPTTLHSIAQNTTERGHAVTRWLFNERTLAHFGGIQPFFVTLGTELHERRTTICIAAIASNVFFFDRLQSVFPPTLFQRTLFNTDGRRLRRCNIQDTPIAMMLRYGNEQMLDWLLRNRHALFESDFSFIDHLTKIVTHPHFRDLKFGPLLFSRLTAVIQMNPETPDHSYYCKTELMFWACKQLDIPLPQPFSERTLSITTLLETLIRTLSPEQAWDCLSTGDQEASLLTRLCRCQLPSIFAALSPFIGIKRIQNLLPDTEKESIKAFLLSHDITPELSPWNYLFPKEPKSQTPLTKKSRPAQQ